MKKLMPLFLILLILAGALYFQEEILDRFVGPSSDSNTQQAPPGLPSLDLGQATSSSPSATETQVALDDESTDQSPAPPGLPSLDVAPDQPTTIEDAQEDTLDLDDLFIEDTTQDREDQSSDGDSAMTAPPGLPALSFGTAPEQPSSQEAPTPDELLPVPNLEIQEFKNSFIKFKYPPNITVQNVSLSSVDLNSIESKLLNISYFNNENASSVQDFVKDSSSVTNFFAESEVVELSADGVDQVFLATDLISQTKFYLIAKDNLFVLIEIDIEREYEFVEQLLIPSIESQII